MLRSKLGWNALRVLMVAGVVAVASCGGDDDSTNAGSVAASESTVPASTSGSSTDATDVDTSESSAPTTSQTSGSTSSPGTSSGLPSVKDRALPPGERHVEDDEGEPVRGGDLVYGLEADSANPWVNYRTSCATSCYLMMTSVSDALFGLTADGEVAPLLIDEYEANADFTEWTLHVREGVTFHDGTPLDGAAVELNLEACQYSALAGAAYVWMDEVTSDGQTVTVTTKEPFVALPRAFTERQCAFMFSPTWMKTLPDVPQRNERPRSMTPALGGNAGGWRSGQAGRARRVQVRVVHPGQRQLVQARAQRRLLAWTQRRHR